MQVKKIGWFVGSLGLLLGAGTAFGDDKTETTGQDVVNQMAGKPECGDTGVTVAFKTGSAELDQNAKGALNGLANWMKANPERTLKLQGYASPTGDAEANKVLSEKRADAVKIYLVGQGVDATKITTQGLGEHVDHLPNEGQAVTFVGCAPANAVAQGTTVPEETPLEQEALPPAPPPAPVVVVTPPPSPAPEAPPPRWLGGYGFAFMVGGAYQDFTHQNMKSVTDTGGAWDARFIGGVNSFIGFEAAYVGAARDIATLGNVSGNQPTLVSNGVEGTLRVNIPIRRGATLIEPYGFGGVGFSHNSITNYNQNIGVVSDFTSTDDILNVPAGGGVALGYKAFLADVRASWTGTFMNDQLLTQGTRDGTFNTWGVGGQVGFIF